MDFNEAHQKLEAAEARIRELEEALRPFSDVADRYAPTDDTPWGDDYLPIERPPLRDFRRARALIKGERG